MEGLKRKDKQNGHEGGAQRACQSPGNSPTKSEGDAIRAVEDFGLKVRMSCS